MSSAQKIQSFFQSTTSSPPSFLDLPPELRLKIYRFLHINSRTIGDSRKLDTHRHSAYQIWDWDQFSMDWYGPGRFLWNRFDSQNTAFREFDPGTSTCRLSGQMLATCKQIYVESSDILYRENTFGLHLYVRESRFDYNVYKVQIQVSFYEGFEIDQLDHPWPAKTRRPRGTYAGRFEEIGYQFPVDKIQRLRLVVDLDSYGSFTDPEFNSFTHTLYKVSQRISCLQLQHLNIDLRYRLSNTLFCILGPLMILRNAREVTFEPEPRNPLLQHGKRNSHSLTESQPHFADYLKRQLESSQPPSDQFLEYYRFQSIATFLGTIKDPSPMLYDHLKHLVKNRQESMCLSGLFEVCKHRAGIDDSWKHQHLLEHDDNRPSESVD